MKQSLTIHATIYNNNLKNRKILKNPLTNPKKYDIIYTQQRKEIKIMKKFIALALALVLLCPVLCSCGENHNNMLIFNTTHLFEEAVIFRADGEQRVRIKNWSYNHNNLIQITLENGDVYLTHSSNIILISTDN